MKLQCAYGESVRAPPNNAGMVTDTYEYDAYGNEFTVPGGSNTPNEFMYRGEQWDSDLGLYYLRARYYNPLTGRFMSRDPEDGKPTDPKTLHKYLYAGGDPVNAKDPTGRDDEVEYQFLFSRVAAETPSLLQLTVDVECAFLGVQALIDQAYHQELANSVPLPFPAYCAGRGIWLLFF